MTSSGKYYDNIIQRLSTFETNVKRSSQLGRTNINKDAERLFCYPLELLFGGQFINLNTVEPNYPAVDLGCMDKRICVQVTSDNEHEKIQSTLNKFFLHGKDAHFDRLIVLIIGERKKYRSSKDTKEVKFPPFELKGRLNFNPDSDIWGTIELLQQIEGLSTEKMEKLSGFLDSQLESTGAMRPYLYLPTRSAVGDGFVGREAELDTIRMQLAGGVKPIVLSGLGGMGKTELAARFGREYQMGAVFFIHFQSSFESTVRSMFTGVFPQPAQPPKENEQFDTVMNLLRRCTEKDLLIVDNVDAGSGTLADLMQDPVYKDLLGMKLRLLLTTRFERHGAVTIQTLTNEELRQIFRRHDAAISTAEMDALIRAVSGHTMAVDLIARTLSDNWVPVSPKEILDAMLNNTLPDADFAEIDADYGDSPEQMQIYQHLRAVFNVAKIPDSEKAIMHFATLLPESGMDLRLFRSCLSKEYLKVFPSLGKRGWLMSDGTRLRIHPIVRLVCRQELKPTDESCGAFLYALWKKYDHRHYDAEMFYQYAEMFSIASDTLPDIEGDRAVSAGIFWDKLGQPQKAVFYNERAVDILERNQPNSRKLASAYHSLGSTYSQLGDHSNALKYKLKGLDIRTQLLPPDHPLLADSCNNVGITYNALHDNSRALEYLMRALKIREKTLQPDNPSTASSYNNVGTTYRKLGDFENALVYQMKALQIRRRIYPKNHPSIANSLNSIGSTYREMKNFDEALNCHIQALNIRKAVLPDNHPDLALSYNNVGRTYSKMQNYAQALEYQQIALSILEQILPPQHPYIYYIRHDIHNTSSMLDVPDKAQEYQTKSSQPQ